jgi:TolB protein
MAPLERVARAALLAGLVLLAACSGGGKGGDPVGGGPHGPIAPCGAPAPGLLAYASRATGAFDIRVARLDGTCDVAITADDASDVAPSFSLAAGAVVFATQRDGKLRAVVYELRDGTERVLDTGDVSVANPAVSPDGRTLMFEGRVALGSSALYVIPLAGGTATRLVDPAGANDAAPAWSPDGATIYFASDRTGVFEIWKVGANGAGAAQVSTDTTAAVRCAADVACEVVGRPAVSPDGLSIAFARATATGTRVVIRTLATGAERVLADADDSSPAFDPAGGRIAVTSYEPGNPDVLVRNVADGSVAHQVTTDAATDGAPAYAR